MLLLLLLLLLLLRLRPVAASCTSLESYRDFGCCHSATTEGNDLRYYIKMEINQDSLLQSVFKNVPHLLPFTSWTIISNFLFK